MVDLDHCGGRLGQCGGKLGQYRGKLGQCDGKLGQCGRYLGQYGGGVCNAYLEWYIISQLQNKWSSLNLGFLLSIW